MSKTALIILTIVVFFLAALTGTWIWSQHDQKNLSSTPLPEPPASQAGAFNSPKLTPELVTDNGQTLLKLWWEPNQGTIPLSTVGLRATFANPNGSLTTQASSPNLNDDYKTPEWKTAFSDITNNPDGTITLKISMVYLAPEPFDVGKKGLVLSFPVKLTPASNQLTLTLDPEVSQAYDKQAQIISFTQ